MTNGHVGRKLLSMDELPEGALSRMIRDFWAMSNREQSFEDFKKSWEANYDKECVQRNIDHPIEYDKEFKLDEYKTVRIFKRKGEDWSCSECDMAPNGGSGPISLEQALTLLSSKVREEVNSVVN